MDDAIIPNACEVISGGSGDSKGFKSASGDNEDANQKLGNGFCLVYQSLHHPPEPQCGVWGGEHFQGTIPSEDTASGVSRLPLFFTYRFGSQGMPRDKLEISGELITLFSLFFPCLFFFFFGAKDERFKMQ